MCEEDVLARWDRDAALNSILEGSCNVPALDLLRALARSPGGLDALRTELSMAAGADSRLDEATGRFWPFLAEIASNPSEAPYQARRLAGLLTVLLQAALLARLAPGPVSDAFCATRLAGQAGPAGPRVSVRLLPRGLDLARGPGKTRT